MRRKILIIRFGSIGDIILTSATVRNLKINFPDCEITFLTKAANATLAGLISGIDEIVTLSNSASIGEWYHLIDTLDSRRFDVIIDLQGKVNSWLIRKLTTANDRITYPKRRWERFRLTRTHRLPAEWPHTIDLYNSAVQQLGGDVYCRRPIVLRDSLPPIDPLWPDGEPALLVAPGAAHATKQWPIERFAQTAIDVHNQRRFHIVWVSEMEERLPETLSTIPSDHFHLAVRLAARQARGTAGQRNGHAFQRFRHHAPFVSRQHAGGRCFRAHTSGSRLCAAWRLRSGDSSQRALPSLLAPRAETLFPGGAVLLHPHFPDRCGSRAPQHG